MMDIKALGIANYKSFDSDCVKIENLGKINIFIGKNNSGKSNVLKFLNFLSELSPFLGEIKIHFNAPLSIQDKRKDPCCSRVIFFKENLENQYERNGKPPELLVNIKAEYIADSYKSLLNHYKSNDELKFRIDILNETFIEHPFNLLDDNVLLRILDNHYSRDSREVLINMVIEKVDRKIFNILKEYFSKLIYIPHFREIKELHSQNQGEQKVQRNFNTVNGEAIISKMFEMKNPKIGEEKNREIFNKIQNFVKDLINVKDLKIEIPHSKDCIILDIDSNRLSLESFGTGIHELVILCSALAIYQDHVFCIEEPEIHLHPELQRKFIKFLEEQTDNIYFISTHSNVFLDYSPDKRIYHVTHDGIKTQIKAIETNKKTYEVLDDLGYKASDILQSNGIIWVEGPSDRIYLKKWLSLVDSELKEGLDYSIMFYSGKVLKHFSGDTEYIDPDFIDILKINKNAIMIIDKDCDKPESKRWKTKQRIKDELVDNCWITNGREIENYLKPETMSRYLTEKFKQEIKFEYDENKKFEEVVKSALENSGCNKTFAYSKVDDSREIINFIEAEDLDILDLKEKIEFLVNSIKKWNFKDKPVL